MEEVKKYTKVLNHLDRISFGQNQLFLFKYPLKHQVKKRLSANLAKIHDENDGDIDQLVEEALLREGITGDVTNLECISYEQNDLEEDQKMT
mmetsp:Transcript_33536/g.51554  ORF Transcript_33536/g.51554 Transcript_33536/m.51554 type:complete len:92 (-) Transcript_33536:2575-2850(-)